MVGLKEVINMPMLASFLQDQAPHSFAMVYTIHTLKKTLVVWKGLNWESFIIGLLEAKGTFKVVVCVRDQKFFKHLFTKPYS